MVGHRRRGEAPAPRQRGPVARRAPGARWYGRSGQPFAPGTALALKDCRQSAATEEARALKTSQGQTIPGAAPAARRDVERGVLDVVSALAAELGTLPAHSPAALDDHLERDLGLGSLERVELAQRLEQAFARRLGDAVLAEAERCRDLVTAVAIAGGEAEAEPAAIAAPAAPATGARAPRQARTLTEVLAWHADATPDRVHIVLRRDTGEEAPITYGDLAAGAGAVAAALRERGVAAGDPVAIMLRTEPAFFPVFLGTLLLGAVPVPMYPPFRPGHLEDYAHRQAGILRNAGARLLVTFAAAARVGRLLQRRVPALESIVTADELAGAPADGRPPGGGPDAVALIQYTSGSTGDPKGVVLTHANLLANIRALGQALAVRPDDVCVSWLPLYHDMGLIGSWLGALYHGIPIVLMSPLAFLARPARWLRALSRHRGTISAAPNFAYDLCVKRVTDADMAGVDLSAWRLALNGSEAVTAETIARFTARFAPSGFRAAAMTPVYGLAEGSVGLTAPPPGRGPRIDAISREAFERDRHAVPAPPDEPSPLRFVSCGRPLPAHDVRIVDGAGRPAPERVEGHVEFRGPSMTAGYHRNAAQTRRVMREGWMDSGDLGYLAGGELHVTGRAKDIIIKAGRNLYPQEIEDVAGGVPGVRRGCVAAFGVPDRGAGTERLVVVAETRAREAAAREAMRAAIVERVVDAVGVPPDTVVIRAPGAVLKTPSGKIRRTATRDAYLADPRGRARPSRRPWVRLAAAETRLALGAAATAAAGAAFALWTGLVLAFLLPPLWVAVRLARRPRTVHEVARRWCRAVLGLTGCGPIVHDLHHLPHRPAVLVANHASYLDVVGLLAALPAGLRFVAKRELLAWPIVGTILKKARHLTVDRTDLARGVADAATVTAAVREGSPVCVFPEGTFVRRPGLLPFRLGAFKAAVEAGCPVVPIAIHGTRDVLPADSWWPRRARIEVRVLPPLAVTGEGWREIVRLRDATRAAIAAAGQEVASPVHD
jgi:1-acyl-sn-glycerol-3-phosphate acyltransferase